MDIPDYIAEGIAGCRQWRLANILWARMGGLLWSDAMLAPWPRSGEYVAECQSYQAAYRAGYFQGRDHQVPDERCGCGIYAWLNPGSVTRTPAMPEDFRHVA